MACVTRIVGVGAFCSTGTPNGQTYDLTYPGECTLAPTPNCHNTLVSPQFPDGTIFSPHYFSSIVSITYEGCANLDEDKPHDCINGNCLPASVHGTVGLYPNSTACKGGCAKNSPCKGECISPAEIAALKQAVANIKSRLCES